MVIQKNYSCGICHTIPDQLSHHKAHLETQKHKDKFELLEKDLAEMKIQRNELDIVQMNLTKAIDLFKQQMNGKSKIYSCSADWQIIESTEKSFGEQQAKFNDVSSKIIGDLCAHASIDFGD